MSALHTKGPWAVTERGGEITIQGPASEWLAVIPLAETAGFGVVCRSELRANARLIAAAPDMLEALRRALNFIENTESEMGETLECGELARAAIARATGAKP